MRRPDPPTQLRQYLAVAKRQGYDFETAWAWALERIKYPHDTGHRRQYKEVLADTRWAYEAAYRDEDVPGGRVLLRLWEAVQEADSEHEPDPVRAPPIVISSGRGTAEPDFEFVPHRAA